jgi:beta-glucosidase
MRIINREKLSITIFLFVLGLGMSAQESKDLNKNGKIDIYEDRSKSIDERIKDAITQMTLEEKVNMLNRNSSSWAYSGCERLGIPEFTCHDGPHGVRDERLSTAYPTTVARGAAFDRDLSYRLGIAEGKEFRAQGWNMRLGNCVDVNRHPLYGRASESAGEDPYLCAEIGVANVLGTQSVGCIANLKHLILNTREDKSLRKNNQTVIDERSLIEIYGYPFKESIQRANAWSVMTAHSRVNGLHSTDNPYVLDTLLRDYWGYRYFVLNDWSSVRDVVQQNEGTVADVFNSGHDLETSTTLYKQKLADEVKAGNVTEERLNEAVSRVLRVLLVSGMIDGQTKANPADYSSKEAIALCREGAQKSLVLLKNEDNILPLKKLGRIALIGPNTAVLPTDAGSSSTVRPIYAISVLEGITGVAPEVKINYTKGCDINSDNSSGFEAALRAAKASDVVVFVGGLDRTQEGEGTDRKSGSSQLPGLQQELINKLAEINPNIVTVVISGGVCALNESIDNIDGLLYAFYGGQESGAAIAEALFGDYNPGGKLPVTMPKTDAELPPFTDDHHDHIVKVGYRWYDSRNIEPQYAFGYGLSYTTFEYSNLRLSGHNTTADKTIQLQLDVKNTGNRAGDEVVQLYISDLDASVQMAEKQLKGFERISLEAGEHKTVKFKITANALSFWDEKSKKFLVEKGRFKVMIGGSSDNLPLQDDFIISADYTVPDYVSTEESIPLSDEEKEADIKANASTLLRVNANEYNSTNRSKDAVEKENNEGEKVLVINHNDWLCYRNINLGTWLNFVDLHIATSVANGKIELRLGAPDGELFGLHTIGATGGWESWETINIGCSDYRISGTHDVYVVFRARENRKNVPVCRFQWWEVEGRKE